MTMMNWIIIALVGVWGWLIVVGGKVAGLWTKMAWWLTCSIDCAWCKRRMRQAFFPRKQMLPGGIEVWRVSHTICKGCLKKQEASLASEWEWQESLTSKREWRLHDAMAERISRII